MRSQMRVVGLRMGQHLGGFFKKWEALRQGLLRLRVQLRKIQGMCLFLATPQLHNSF